MNKLKNTKQFLYWIEERHKIHLARLEGKSPPWTKDKVLQQFFFTNPYRENDKTTIWFRENVRDVLANSEQVIFATIAFRWFNFIPTGHVLCGHNPDNLMDSKAPYLQMSDLPTFYKGGSLGPNLLINWNYKEAVSRLKKFQRQHGKVFTGAYIIKSPNGKDKITGICDCIQAVWSDRERLTTDMETYETLEQGWKRLLEYAYLGGFMAYEVITDLRHTYLFREASDIDTWCNMGPGATRGLRRVLGIPPKGNLPPDWKKLMGELHFIANQEFVNRKEFPELEMREIEHSLCEFDKYMRALEGDGQLKRRYEAT